MNYTDLQERFPGINIDKYSDKKKDDMIKKLIITEINKKNNEDLLSKDKDLIKKYTDLGIKKEKLFIKDPRMANFVDGIAHSCHYYHCIGWSQSSHWSRLIFRDTSTKFS